jgi:opacity protein-like surface antigen
MKKRFGLAFLGLLAANSAFAGLYVGAGGGYQYLVTQRYSYTMPSFIVGDPVTTAYKKGTGSAGIGNLFMGYEFRLGQRFGIAAEAVFQPGKTEAKIVSTRVVNNTVIESETSTKSLHNSWGFNAKPAFYLTDATKLFATVGWQQAQVKYAGRSDQASAFVAGGGLEVALPMNGEVADSPLAVRAEYAVADYSQLLFIGAMRTHSVLFSLVYKFS